MKNTKILYNSEITNIQKNKNLNKKERDSLVLSQELKEILIGLILGDAHLEKQSLTANARLRFSQGLIHKEYFELIFLLFKPYCASDKSREYNYLDKRFQKVYFSLHFQTRALLCFTEVYILFYKNGKKNSTRKPYGTINGYGTCLSGSRWRSQTWKGFCFKYPVVYQSR